MTHSSPRTAPSAADARASWIGSLPSLSRILSVVMLILGIVAIGVLFYRVMAGFFVPLFLAVLLVVIFRPLHEWVYRRVGNRPRTAAGVTTSIVLFLVLLPVILILSIAAAEFTSLVSHVKNLDDIEAAMERGRNQFGISLPYPAQFRRLDELTSQLNSLPRENPRTGATQEVARIDEAITLIRYLNKRVSGPPEASEVAAAAIVALRDYRQAVVQYAAGAASAGETQIISEQRFYRLGVSASASVRRWMRLELGGTFRSQVRLLANPSPADMKALLNSVREMLQPRFVSLTSATGSFVLQTLIGLIVLVIAVYFFLVDGAGMIRTLMRLSPLDDNYEERLLREFDRTSRAVVLASVLSALVQGILAAIAYAMLGFESVILLFLLTTLMALVPFLGAASVWAPCAIYLGAVEQRWTAALFLAIYGAAVVSSIDNVIKVYVLHGRSTLHPLFALLSVLGGVQVFGPIGILVGPMVVVFLQTLLEILNHELAGRDSATVHEPLE